MKFHCVGFIVALVACTSSKGSQVQPKTAAPAPSASASEISEKGSLALESALAWLALLEQEKFADTWSQASSEFRSRVTQDKWVEQLENGTSQLGPLEDRQIQEIQYSDSLPDVPAGEYVVMQFDSNFAKAGKLTEMVTALLEPDGTWRVLGYFIKP